MKAIFIKVDFTTARRITCFGASTMHGQGDSSMRGGFVGRLKELHEKDGKGKLLYNLAISGEIVEQLHDRFKVEALKRNPDLIIIQFSNNDCRREGTQESPPVTPLSDFKEFVENILTQASEICPILVIGTHPIDDTKTTPISWVDHYYMLYDVLEYERAVKEICKRNGVSYVEIMSGLLKSDYKKLLADDGLHLNADGYEYVFERICEELDIKECFENLTYK